MFLVVFIKVKQHKTGQYRDNGNIVHTRLDNTETMATLYTQDWTIQRHWQHCTHKTGQYRGTGNIVHTRLDNTETLATLYTQGWTIQRHWQHCTHKAAPLFSFLCCVVVSFCVLFVFILCLVCTMLPVSLYCPVLCVQCCQCLYIWSKWTNN
jgi:hypothetical protein